MKPLTPVRERWAVTTPPQKRALSERIADHCMTRTYPWVSLSSFEREALRVGVPASIVSEVLEDAKTVIAEKVAESVESSDWLGLTEAASTLGVSISWARDCLESREGRRLLGYPWYDGRRWHIPAPACRPGTRADFLAALPESEPPENIALLDLSKRQACAST